MKRFLCLFILCMFPGITIANPGDYDTTFGHGGIVVMSLGREYRTTDMDLLPDGKIVVAGRDTQAPDRSLLARYNPDGTLDRQFGHNGFVIRSGIDSIGSAIAVDRKGRILVAGTTILRFNTNGSPDLTFADNGKFVFEPGAGFNDVLVLPDQRIVATGSGGRYGDDVLLVMLTASGRLDRRFAGRGFVTANRSDDRGKSVAVDSLGRIIVGGNTGIGTYSGRDSYDFMLLRYKIDGRLDQSFGRRGRAVIKVSNYSDDLRKVVTLPGNELLSTGAIFSSSDGAVAKLLSNGRRDREFGSNGVIELSEFRNSSSNDLAVQSDGRIVVCGNGGSSSEKISYAATIFRFLPDGRLDNSFHGDGIRFVTFGRSWSSSAACAITSDEKLIVAGTVSFGHRTGIALARLLLQKWQ